MLKTVFLSILALLTLCSGTPAYSMNYIPKVCKTASFWATVGAATVFSASLYAFNYWQDSANRAFYDAVMSDDSATARRLLAREEIDYKRRSKDGKNLLHYTVMRGQFALAQLFVRDLEMLNQEDAAGCTPLYYAIQRQDAQMCKMLRNAGANRFCCSKFTTEIEEELARLLI